MPARAQAVDARASLERMRRVARARNAGACDWRLVLLPAAIRAGATARALRLCAALCDRQRGRSFYLEVIVGLDVLAEELGVTRQAVIKDNKQLMRLSLLDIASGGGRLPASKVGKANVYRLGDRLSGVDNPPDTVSPATQLTVSKTTRYPRASRTAYSVAGDTPHPYGVLRTPSGDRGVAPPLDPRKRTAGSRRRASLSPDALTRLNPKTPEGLRGLFGDDDPVKRR